MKTLKLTFTLIALFAFQGFAQVQRRDTAPAAPPSCLSGPVTQGTVAVTCTAVDNTASLVSTDAPFLALNYPAYFLFVRAVSTDPGVLGFRITVTCASSNPSAPVIAPGVAMIGPTSIAPPVPMTYVFSNLAGCDWPIKITSVNVQELKASSSQSF